MLRRFVASSVLPLRRKVVLSAATTRGFHASSRQATQYTAPLSEIKFLVNDVHDVHEHYKGLENTGGALATEDMIDMVLGEMGKFCENELSPLNSGADEVGCTWVDEHTVTTPPGFKEAYNSWVEGGWQGLEHPEEFGGQGLPGSLSVFATEMAATANWTWTMFPGLSRGAINTMRAHANDELKEKYLPRLVSGEWTGTMCLTQPHCGSDLAQVGTKAEDAARRHVQDHGHKDLHLLRRARHHGQHRSHRARQDAGRSPGHQGHLTLPRAAQQGR